MIDIAIVYHSETGNTAAMAEMVAEGCRGVDGLGELRLMEYDKVDTTFLERCRAVILGSPNYEGCCSWQIKKFLDTPESTAPLAGKLGGVFVTQNWAGRRGRIFRRDDHDCRDAGCGGMMIYAGGIAEGYPPVHFGAVARKIPEGIDRERAVKLGRNIAAKAVELWG